MGRPSKPYAVIVSEGKSHRTKGELAAKEKGEAAFATGVMLKERPEVQRNKVAHKEFLRIGKLLLKIKKFDAIYEGVINRYCLLYGECLDFEEKREQVYKDLEELGADKEKILEEGMSLSWYYKQKATMQKTLLGLDKQVQAKRKMLMDIEKENIMTIASAMRNIPKTSEEAENPILAVLRGGQGD